MKNKLQPIRTSFSRNFQCKKAPRWLDKFFHFGTENGEGQLKKSPCRQWRQQLFLCQGRINRVSTTGVSQSVRIVSRQAMIGSGSYKNILLSLSSSLFSSSSSSLPSLPQCFAWLDWSALSAVSCDPNSCHSWQQSALIVPQKKPNIFLTTSLWQKNKIFWLVYV